MNKIWMFLCFWFFCSSGLQKVSLVSDPSTHKKIDQKRYDWLLKRLPSKYHEMFFNLVENKHDLPVLIKKEDKVIQDKRTARQIVDWYDLFTESGGTGQLLDELKSDKAVVIFSNKNLDLFAVRTLLGKMLSAIISHVEGLKAIYSYQSIYFLNNKSKIYEGTRAFGQYSEKKCLLQNYESRQYDLCGGKRSFEKGLVGFYKIHLMPQEEEILHAVERLIEVLKKDPELRRRMEALKVQAALWGEDKMPFKNSENIREEQYRPAIVIYPSWGKENVQKLLDALLVIFKDFKGSGNTPRFNIKVNDLIFYAQGDGDYKMDPVMRQKYFDSRTNYALYRPDFQKVMADLKKPYIGKDENPYALKVS